MAPRRRPRSRQNSARALEPEDAPGPAPTARWAASRLANCSALGRRRGAGHGGRRKPGPGAGRPRPSAAGKPRPRGDAPALVGDDAPLLLAEVAPHARRQPVAPAGAALPGAGVQRVQHVEDVSAGEAQARRGAGLQLEVRADVEGVAHAGLHHFPEDCGPGRLGERPGPPPGPRPPGRARTHCPASAASPAPRPRPAAAPAGTARPPRGSGSGRGRHSPAREGGVAWAAATPHPGRTGDASSAGHGPTPGRTAGTGRDPANEVMTQAGRR